MLDHRLFLQEPAQVIAQLKRRSVDPALIANLAALAEQRRDSIQRVEGLRQKLNQASGDVQQKMQAGDKAAAEQLRNSLRELKTEIKSCEESQGQAEAALEQALQNIPNLPHASVPDGVDETSNRVERVVSDPRVFDFAPKAHFDLGEALGIISFEQASKVSGSRFAVMRGAGARLERALINFMLDLARQNGYHEIIPPLLVRLESMFGAGQYPKFIGESFETLDREYALIPTSEVPLVNLHRDDILDEEALPIRYTAYTPCFRREAGAAGRDTRGLIRLHQFNKVELVSYTTPEQSEAEHERLTSNAEEVLKRLELPYRVMCLSAGDLSFCATKTYDLEVWLPAQNQYREISSCSNCTDYQARRSHIRYRPSSGDGKKTRLVHVLNGSGVAVGRALVAILENYQEADGSIRIPRALVSYFGGERITRETR